MSNKVKLDKELMRNLLKAPIKKTVIDAREIIKYAEVTGIIKNNNKE